MGTTADGGTEFKERTGGSGKRPIGAASFRQQSHPGVMPPHPPGGVHARHHEGPPAPAFSHRAGSH